MVDCKCLATHFVSLHSHPRTASHNVPYPYNHKVPYPYNNNVSYSYNHNVLYSYNHNVPYPYNQNVPYSNNHNFPILLQLTCPVFLVLEKELDFTNLTKWFYSMYLRINCILKKQRCLCNSKIKFQIQPLAGKNLIELFSWNADAGEMREFNHMTFILKWTLHEPNKYRLYASFCHKKGTC